MNRHLFTIPLLLMLFGPMSVYARSVNLKELTKNNHIVLNQENYGDLRYLLKLPVMDLTIRGKLSKENITTLSQLKHLGRFAVAQNFLNLKSIDHLKPLSNLTELDVSDNPIADYSALAGLTKITVLTASAEILRQLPSLVKLQDLKQLTLRGGSYKSLRFVKLFPKLEILSLQQVEGIRRDALSELALSSSLRAFDASTLQTGVELDLHRLRSPYLRTLLLDGFKVKNVDALANVPNLVGLTLSDAGMENTSALPRLKYLRRLNLTKNQITSLPEFSRFENLHTLTMYRNLVGVFNPRRLPKTLSRLELSGNPACEKLREPELKKQFCASHLPYLVPSTAKPPRKER